MPGRPTPAVVEAVGEVAQLGARPAADVHEGALAGDDAGLARRRGGP